MTTFTLRESITRHALGYDPNRPQVDGIRESIRPAPVARTHPPSRSNSREDAEREGRLFAQSTRRSGRLVLPMPGPPEHVPDD